MDRYQFTSQERNTLESLPQPLGVYQFIDKRVVTLILSDGFCELFGYDDRALAYHDMDNDMYKCTHPDDIARISEAALSFAVHGGEYDVYYRSRQTEESGYHIIHASGRHSFTDTGVRLAYIWYTDEGTYSGDTDGSASDFRFALGSALRAQCLSRASQYDFLTGLPNMNYFFELAQAGKDVIEQNGNHAVMLYIDLIGMKYYNSNHGFSEGDNLLKAFAKLLVRTFSTENCCHIGGDHFAVYTTEEGIEDTINELFRDCLHLNEGKTLPVRVGIYPASLQDVPASTACDRAKFACDSLRNVYESAYNYFNEDLRDEAERRQYIISNIDRAISEGFIQVYYQPIVRTVNEKICDEEALARWIDPERGFLSPAEFIPHLEDAGLIYKLDLYVLEQILMKMQRQKADGLRVASHSVNLSRSDFDSCDIVEEICRRVDAAGISRSKITIEITESMISSDLDFMKEQVERFRSLGFPVWMDDFGSGYSSLDVLQSIKFDLIKFDMSFMKKLDQGVSGKIILTELMKMATALGVDTVCEGVETIEQMRFLREIGCSKLQGYYYCKPVPYSQILEFYKHGFKIEYENPEEVSYYDAMGRINLYDLSVIANEDDSAFHNSFSTLPMGIIEVRGDKTRFVKSNQSYRDFIKRFFGFDLSYEGTAFTKYDDNFMNNVVKTCCEQGICSLYDETMPDGTVIHSFARRVSVNPVNNTVAVAVAVLSITDPTSP